MTTTGSSQRGDLRPRVLVAAASRHSSTAEIAERIARVLTERGCDVRLAAAEDVRSLDDLDAVVLGSALYYGRWLPAALSLAQRCGTGPRVRDVWLFSSGPVGTSGGAADVSDVMSMTGARSHELFGGRLDRANLPLRQRLLMRLMRAQVGDSRDWSQIKVWAGTVADELCAASPAARSL